MSNQTTTRNLTVPKIVAIVGNVLMLLCVFLPYASVAKDSPYREYADEMVDGVRAGELADPSMFKFATLYNKLKDQTSNGSEIAMIVMALVAAIAITAIIALIFACVSKGIPALVFSIIGFLLFLVLNWDFSDRGVVPTDDYSWGFGYYLFYAAALVAVVGAIWMIVSKRRDQ